MIIMFSNSRHKSIVTVVSHDSNSLMRPHSCHLSHEQNANETLIICLLFVDRLHFELLSDELPEQTMMKRPSQ
jgi:hypothetical protein